MDVFSEGRLFDGFLDSAWLSGLQHLMPALPFFASQTEL